MPAQLVLLSHIKEKIVNIAMPELNTLDLPKISPFLIIYRIKSYSDVMTEKLYLKDYSMTNEFEWKNLRIGVEICADSGSLYRQGKTE